MGLIGEIFKFIFSIPKKSLNTPDWIQVQRIPNWAYRKLIRSHSGQGSPIQIIKVKGKHFEYKLKTVYLGGFDETFTFYKRKRGYK